MIHIKKTLWVTFLILSMTAESVFAFNGEDSSDVPDTDRFSFSGSIGLAASYTGFSMMLLPEVSRRKHTVYLGPALSLSNSYLPGKRIMGLGSGWRFTPYSNPSRRISFFISLNYQFLLYAHTSRLGAREAHNHIHELHFCYGMTVRLMPGWSLTNTIGIGRYAEYFYNAYRDRRERYSGYSNLITVSVTRIIR